MNAENATGICKHAASESSAKSHAFLSIQPYGNQVTGAGQRRFGNAFQPGAWESVGNLLLPGAFGMTFAPARGAHRMACAIEDAGFIINPTIFVWSNTGDRFFPIILFQNPFREKAVQNILCSGAGALNIEAARVKGPRGNGVWGTNQINCRSSFNGSPENASYRTKPAPGGRWPANLILQHSPGCVRVGRGEIYDSKEQIVQKRTRHSKVYNQRHAPADGNEMKSAELWDCAPGCPVAVIDRQDMAAKSRTAGDLTSLSQYIDNSGASRFFFRADWENEVKPRTGTPISLITWLSTLLLPPAAYAPRRLLVIGETEDIFHAARESGWEEVKFLRVGPILLLRG